MFEECVAKQLIDFLDAKKRSTTFDNVDHCILPAFTPLWSILNWWYGIGFRMVSIVFELSHSVCKCSYGRRAFFSVAAPLL